MKVLIFVLTVLLVVGCLTQQTADTRSLDKDSRKYAENKTPVEEIKKKNDQEQEQGNLSYPPPKVTVKSETKPPLLPEIYINNKKLTASDIELLKNKYKSAPPEGRYWYDKNSGLWGASGREATGFINAGHEFGEISSVASNGNTGVFLNARELPAIELQFFQRVFGQISSGRYWMDKDGYVGLEGGQATANFVLALQQLSQSSQGSSGRYGSTSGEGYRYSNSLGSSYGGVEGGCVWISSSSGSAMSSGC